MFKLPKELKEISGIELVKEKLFGIADSGNENIVYQIDNKGDIVKRTTITDAENIDWEDLASDAEGNLYIGDFGNNDNERRDLSIYKISSDSLDEEQCKSVSKISFSYPEQKDFPPKKSELWYDVEAFIVYKNHFYLFTKNRSKKFDGTTLLYRVPMHSGNHEAKLIGSFKTEANYNNNAITGAAINSEQNKIVILSHSKIWLFEDFKGDNFFSGKTTELPLQHYSQKEAVTFKNNSTLWIADEKVKKNGGNIYQFHLNELN
ncbi:hypothetical protein ABGT15_04895 [Flavobacterium enshiense]|uniref:hypothetical protein n=1 Tax=Flavobacterium enshiense TaxID=1341165 RepID=UPI00345DA7CA